MAYIVRLPGLGMQQDRATLVAWHAETGEEVSEGEPIAEIETEKTTYEIEAKESGVLRRIYADVGDVRQPNDPLGIVAEADADVSELEAAVDAESVDADPGAESQGRRDADAPAPAGDGTDTAARGAGSGSSTNRKVTPRARKRAAELGVEVDAAEGTGLDGAVTAEDVERAAETAGPGGGDGSASALSAEPERVTPRARKRAAELGVDPATVEGTGLGGAVTADDVAAAADSGGAPQIREERPFSEMRRTIARRLHESYAEAVHVTVDRAAEAEELLEAVEAAERALETDVSRMDMLLVALSAALEEHPEFNATADEETHYLYEEQNVGVAVDVDRGLIAPVLEDVESKSLEAIARERRELTERALADEFTPEDLEGGTFTVTNLGPFGVESFDPIIDPPQVAILGVNAVEERATTADGGETLQARRHLPLSLSFDHRVVDGADAARFLGTLVEHLEDPWPLLPEAVSAPAEETDLPERSVSARTAGDLSGTVTAGSFEWFFDEPSELGGAGSAPTPVDRFLGALASCLAASVGFQASKRDVDLSNVRVDAEGHPEGGSLESIDLTVRLTSPADDETLSRLVEIGERGCHVADVLREDLPVTVTWERA